MIQLEHDQLEFSFPEVHKDAVLHIEFQRTLRIPDDDREYPLPAGLGRFPLELTDSHAARVPDRWLRRGGVMLPMYQSEALWISFGGSGYPFAVKIAAGKIDAATGEDWTDRFARDPQNYLVTPGQPWLDGFCVEKGIIRQFVAMPLGSGYSAEEQIHGKAEHGGLQILACPLKPEVYERMQKELVSRAGEVMDFCLQETCSVTGADMGLAPGGKMRQEIFEDPHDLADWDLEHSGRCFVHLANSLMWRAVTGKQPPTVPPTSREYANAGIPWFDYYAADAKAVEGSERLAQLKSVIQMAKTKGDVPVVENDPVEIEKVVVLGDKRGQVREGTF